MRIRERGFTLVEIMVALLVTGLVIAAAQAAFAAVADAWARSRAARQPVLAGAAARDALSGWLRSAALLEGAGPFDGIHWSDGAGELDQLTFGVTDGGPLRAGPHRVRLWVSRDPRSARQGLLVELSPIRGGALAPAETLSIAPAATGLALRYRVVVDGRELWLREWQSEDRLPRAVELRLSSLAWTRLGGISEVALPPLLDLPVLVPIVMEGW